jgi:hypothetical protein
MIYIIQYLLEGSPITIPEREPSEWKSYVVLIENIAAVVTFRGIAPIMK